MQWAAASARKANYPAVPCSRFETLTMCMLAEWCDDIK